MENNSLAEQSRPFEEEESPQRIRSGIEPGIFIPSILVVIAFCLLCAFNKESVEVAMKTAFKFTTGDVGWIYSLFQFSVLLILVYLVLGPLGKKRFGNESPEFSTFSWMGLMFGTSSSLMILLWSTMEFFYYIQSPPFRMPPFSPEAYEWSQAYSLFHWGPMFYCPYLVFAVVYAYFFFVQKREVYRPSTACEPIFGEQLMQGWLGKLFDTFFVISILCGAGTSLGLGIPLIAELLKEIFGIPLGMVTNILVVLSWTLFFTYTIYSGLKKGIKVLDSYLLFSCCFGKRIM
ncbi:L-carnitine/gamma-butyrobetaine antiporter [Desulfocicer vacuolatum DSM 3385]|uniref:L-carnitine/gamma-butyrobetaine antiporter n=1 Tax=Desulfocicer vacuolatum DSM 3385 TaxID=1121400 RepID=A0A1W2F160_9BACT|nr:BCCT family transporter [Desulfocicer vacuolatum]SMD15651.1 L-carnitine/gamma-butyrobetaine antiporter [Desulfocicer vacuolatum DSM 3385]